jgi:EAL domain-containing protein (putative c-di-GMP-specific phosphodiesterase class I)
VGFEALARLVNADGVNVPPDVFIGIAEEIGLIHQLGLRILDLACGQLAHWRHHTPGSAGITMAVNLSAIQAADGSLGGDVHKALTTHALQPQDLILELTETALLQAAHSTIVNLRVLHDEGVGIAIDDFGIGYASLRYLATLPVSALKIDRSFTAGLPHDDVSRKIVMAVAGLAADLDMTCVVEGVETQEQLNALPPSVQLQGYLTGRPQPPEAIDLRKLIAHGAVPASSDSSRDWSA